MSKFKSMDKGALTSNDMKKPKYKALYACLVLFMLVYCTVIFIPILWLLVAGFKSPQEMYAIPATFFPKEIHLSKLATAWKSMDFMKLYKNTFILAGGCVFANVAVSGMAGYGFSKLKPKGSGVLSKICFSLMLIPSLGGAVPLYVIFKNMGILNTYWPMWLTSMVNIFDVFLFKSFFDGISPSLVEAGRIDGAGNLHIFLKIMLPLSIPIFIVVAVFAFNAQMGNFFWPYLIIKDPEKLVLGVQLYKMRSSPNLTMDYQLLACLFTMIPQIIIFAIFQKQIIGGINVGGVKG